MSHEGSSTHHEPTDGLKVDIKKLHNRDIPRNNPVQTRRNEDLQELTARKPKVSFSCDCG